MMRPRYVRRFPRRFHSARKRNWVWVREEIHNAGPANPNSNDLLATWRTRTNLAFNVLDFTIWRIHLIVSISIHITAASYTADQGVGIGVYVDSANQTQFSGGPIGNQYDQHFMLWDKLYLSEQLVGGTTGASTATNLYTLFHRYDIRVRRKLVNENDTLWMQLSNGTATTMDEFNLFYSVLLGFK